MGIPTLSLFRVVGQWLGRLLWEQDIVEVRVLSTLLYVSMVKWLSRLTVNQLLLVRVQLGTQNTRMAELAYASDLGSDFCRFESYYGYRKRFVYRRQDRNVQNWECCQCGNWHLTVNQESQTSAVRIRPLSQFWTCSSLG
jgi:hypothetical protein